MKAERKENNIFTFELIENNKNYLVVLEPLKSSASPRYKAIIIYKNYGVLINIIYIFKGDYLSKQEEARKILKYYLEGVKHD